MIRHDRCGDQSRSRNLGWKPLTAMSQRMEHPDTTVIYNGACPICSREIAGYRRYSETRALPIAFRDLNAGDLATWGLSADQAARRLYVVRDGTLHDGVPAFAVLWEQMPRFRWLARLVRLPGLRQGTTLVYDRVLAPLLYAMHRRRVSRAQALGKAGPRS